MRPGQRRAHHPNRIGANPVAAKSFELRGERPGRLENATARPQLPQPVVVQHTPVGFGTPPVQREPIYGAGLA
jgi:hypothetical protein